MNIVEFLRQQKAGAGSFLSYAVATGSFAGFLLILQAWCLAHVINAVIFLEQTLADVFDWLLAMLLLFVLRALLAYLAEQLAFAAATRIKLKLRSRLFRHIQALGPLYLTGERSGELATSVSDGVEALEDYYAGYLPAMSLAALVPFSILAFVLPLDWRSALVMLVTAPLIPFFMILIGKGAERLNQQQWAQLQRMGGHFLDVIQGLTTLKLFNASRREALVIARISEDYRLATMKVLRVAFLSALALEFFATVSIAIVAVLIGFRLLFGELDFFTGFFILLLAPEFYLPLRSFGTQYHARMQAIGAAERIVEILQTPLPESQRHASSPTVLPDRPFRIDFQQVTFSYADDVPALAGVDFSVAANERVALVGPSGAGKSTIVNMLLGFIQPQQGQVLVNGVDLSQLEPAAWYRQLAWVPQRARLFHGSIADNLCLGLSDITAEQMQEALRLANADEFVAQLPGGLNTRVGEAGRMLSGGQIQRLVLARAFLRDAGLILLDEATANLDADTEQLVTQAIARLSESRTVITVAHRLATVKNADRILVLEHGGIVQKGPHVELLAQPGLYQRLVMAQGVET